MFVTPTPTDIATAVASASPIPVVVTGYNPAAISVGDTAIVGLLLFGFGLLIVLTLLLLLRRNV